MVQFRFQRTYFGLFLLLLLTEILIAVYAHDDIIRPVGGDYLVVILLYCACRSILRSPIPGTALAVLLVAYGVEITQYFRLADHLGLGRHSLLRVIIGSSFSWGDMAAYTLGITTVLIIEQIIQSWNISSRRDRS